MILILVLGLQRSYKKKYSEVENYDSKILAILQADPKCTQIMLDEEIEEAENYNGTCVDLKAKHERCLNL